MNISKMDEQTKSVLLGKLIGQRVSDGFVYFDDLDYTIGCANLYAPINMALAWHVLNWAMLEPTAKFAFLSKRLAVGGFMCIPPELAQKIWLDKILKLAIEAGLVKFEGTVIGIDTNGFEVDAE